MHRDKKSASPVTSPRGGAGAGRLAGGTLLERARKALRQKSADIIETSVSLNQVAGLADGGGEAEAAAQEGKRDEVQTGEGSVSVSEEEKEGENEQEGNEESEGENGATASDEEQTGGRRDNGEATAQGASAGSHPKDVLKKLSFFSKSMAHAAGSGGAGGAGAGRGGAVELASVVSQSLGGLLKASSTHQPSLWSKGRFTLSALNGSEAISCDGAVVPLLPRQCS